MNKTDAHILAGKIIDSQLQELMDNAQAIIEDYVFTNGLKHTEEDMEQIAEALCNRLKKGTKAAAKTTKTTKASVIANTKALAPVVKQIQAEGSTSLRQIGAALQAKGIYSPEGKNWVPSTVRALLRRINEMEAAGVI